LVISWIFIQVIYPLYICKRNLQAAIDKEDFGLIAVISNIGVRLKLWVGMANLYFLCLHIILDWQKQYNKSGSLDFKC